MKQLTIYQVDAFAEKLFEGNPAAVVPLTEWLPDATMQKIASENNLSETVFFCPSSNQVYDIRWFTPSSEVDLCGHATLAAAWVIFNRMDHSTDMINFSSKSGSLCVRKQNDLLTLDFPIWPLNAEDVNRLLAEKLNLQPEEQYRATDAMLVLPSAEDVRKFEPDFSDLLSYQSRCVIITAPGEGGIDFVSRIFCPAVDVPEDPVTGSSHCMLTPYWAKRLNKNRLTARQISTRGGTIECEIKDDRVYLSGHGQLYLEGIIYIA